MNLKELIKKIHSLTTDYEWTIPEKIVFGTYFFLLIYYIIIVIQTIKHYG
jgi:hypothetical protein